MKQAELNKVFAEIQAETKAQNTPKAIEKISLKGDELKTTQHRIIKEAVSLNKKRVKKGFPPMVLVNVFHKGMGYKDDKGNQKVAGSDGFRYEVTSKRGIAILDEAGKQKIGTMRI